MHVLTLTTNADAPFMNEQMRALERRGVSFSTLSVSGEGDGGNSRSPIDYLRYFPEVIAEAGNDYDLVHAHYADRADGTRTASQAGRALAVGFRPVRASRPRESRLCAAV